MFSHRTILAAVVLALLVAAPAEGAIRVDSTAELRRAIDRAGNRSGTIVVERGRYGKIVVGPRSSRARWLTIRGKRGALIKNLVVARAYRVKIEGLRVTNYWGGDARLLVTRSRSIRLERLTVVGKPGRLARIRVQWSSGVRLRFSDISRCGDRTVCVGTPSSNDVTVSGNSFHDCFGCDFVAVSRVVGMRIAGNTFDRALPSGCDSLDSGFADAELAATAATGCNHQDLVQVVGAHDLTVEGNRFGVYDNGAAQLYVSGQYGADNIVIRGNHFLAADESAPGVVPVNGIIVGNPPGFRGLPSRVLIEGNLVESGAPRDPGRYLFWPGVANSLIVSDGYLDWPVEERPVVVGNTFGAMSSPELVCATAQVGPGQGC